MLAFLQQFYDKMWFGFWLSQACFSRTIMWVVTLTLLLMVAFSTIYDSTEFVQLKCRNYWYLSKMVKIRVIMINNMSLFTICELLLQNVLKILPTIYQAVAQGTRRETVAQCWFNIRKGKLYIIWSFTIKWIYLFERELFVT